jgi:hypothetical protein
MMRHVPWAPLLLFAAACDGGGATGPWLTYVGVDGHSVYFQLSGTLHEPSPTGAIQCSSCHTGSTFAQFSCTGCHDNGNPTPAGTSPTDSLHTGIAGYLWDSATCLTCHPKGNISHTFFPIGAGTRHNLLCNACHTDLHDKTNLAKLACVSCHASTPPPAGVRDLPTAHRQIPDPEYPLSLTTPTNLDSPDCIRCHADSQVDRIADHGLRPPPAGLTNSNPAGPSLVQDPSGQHMHCFQCHSGKPAYFGGTASGPRGPWAQDWGTTGCVPMSAACVMSCTPCH